MRNRIIIIILMIAITIIVGFSVYFVNKEKNNLLQKDENTNEVNESVSNSPEIEDVLDLEDFDINDHEMKATSQFEGYRKATEADKAKYEITNVNKSSNSKYTTITGSIKNKGASENVVIKADFKGEQQASSSIEVKNLKINQMENFEIRILNNIATDDYTVYVEYVGE